MINMKQLLAKVIKSLFDYLSSDDHMRHLIVRLVKSSCIERLESHKTEQLVHVHWNLVNNCVDDDHHCEHLAEVSLRVVVSISYRDQCHEHAVKACLELVWLRIDNRVEVLQHHEKH